MTCGAITFKAGGDDSGHGGAHRGGDHWGSWRWQFIAGVRSEKIDRGGMRVGGELAVLSHIRVTVDDAEPHDEVAHQVGEHSWQVVATNLTVENAAALFSALDGMSVDSAGEIDTVARGILTES